MRKMFLVILTAVTVFSICGSGKSEEIDAYTTVFQGIAREYSGGFSYDTPWNEQVKTAFWDPENNKVLIKLAADSDLRSYFVMKSTYVLVAANYWDWKKRLNLLKDQDGNGDYYLLSEKPEGLSLLGKLPRYKHCSLWGTTGRIEIECDRNDGFYRIEDVFELKIEKLEKVKSETRFEGRR